MPMQFGGTARALILTAPWPVALPFTCFSPEPSCFIFKTAHMSYKWVTEMQSPAHGHRQVRGRTPGQAQAHQGQLMVRPLQAGPLAAGW